MHFYIVIIPLVFIVLGSIVAHAVADGYWTACRKTGIWAGLSYLLFLVAFGHLEWDTPLIAVGAGLVAFVVSMTVGGLFLVNRRLQKFLDEYRTD